MFNNQMTSTTENENDCTEEHNLSNERKEQKFIVDVSPSNDNRYFVKRAYTSPRILSKSVPRRNRNFIRYKINRSLSFDNTKNDRLFKSPNSSSGNSSFDNDKYLTRSAKIMRALNFNCSPFYNQRKKIKKTLNFNLTPSPKKFSNLRISRDNINFNLTSSSPKINKTLNFDTSPSDSSTSSILLTSFDSMDENQNQTPSQRNTKTKKLLNYITPKKRMYVSSPDMDISSPSLRLSLKEKIDDIVQMSSSPIPHSFNKDRKALNFNTRCNISTPRNLYADFSNDDDERPRTPENTISIVPESMSAIKKSHKKERSLRQTDNLSTKHANVLQKLTDPFMVEQFDDLQTEKRPLTPPMAEKSIVSVCDTNSIKQSHKKDKKSIEQGNIHEENNLHDTDFNLNKNEDNVDCDSNSNNVSVNSIGCCELINSSNETVNDQIMDNVSNMDAKSSSCLEEQTCNIISQNPLPSTSNANEKSRSVTPNALETNSISSVKVITPENHINFLQHIQTESIKKSHKKIKDENRKKLFLPRSLENKLKEEKLDTTKNKHSEVSKDDQNDNNILISENCIDTEINVRASTPENVNSSRLLLSNFSSVKKSHKKDKHNKIVSEFMRRQKLLSKDADYNNVQREMHNDVNKKDQRKIKNKSINSDGTMSNLHLDNIKFNNKLSPSKRKILSNLSDDDLLHLLCNSKSTQSEDGSTEEFKICTPIKKRKPLLKTGLKSDCLHDVQSDKNDSFEEEIMNIDASRCITPTLRHLGCTVLPAHNTDLLKTNNDGKIANNEKSNSVEEQQQPDTQDQNGRSTPKNMSTIELLPNINSIKKSHKKDKRGNGLHRSLILEQEKLLLKKNDYEFLQVIDHRTSTIVSKPNDNKSSLADNTSTNILSNGSNNSGESSRITIYKNPQSYNQNINVKDRKNILTNDTTSSNKTPPNCLMVKNYIRLLQTTSIKKSHKKERDRKKHKIINNDLELSDEGSIFGENEKVDSLEDLHIEINSNETDIDRSDYV
uniref:probable cyclin-dependent serine/threonine-protein kinase DDB_G0292550 isoform X2 n=1 Tax=Vespula vulgaris TaxID=7454 RepID=UPI00212B18E7|nr:probable cyclin-dependent serine/threonine-protein kinase DDB_G0292550 isoform X2 [Vespula vulgaris]